MTARQRGAVHRAVRFLIVLLLLVAPLACGDTDIFVSVNTGVVVGDPVCDFASGRFDLRNEGAAQTVRLGHAQADSVD
jgi:hypothetical protein